MRTPLFVNLFTRQTIAQQNTLLPPLVTVAAGTFTTPVSTGNQVISTPFNPDLLLFYYNGVNDNNAVSDAASGEGFFHTSGQGVSYVAIASDGSEVGQRTASNACIAVITPARLNIATATVSARSDSNFTLNWTAVTTQFTVTYVAIKWNSTLQIASGSVSSSTSPVNITQSFLPDLLLLCGNNQNLLNGTSGLLSRSVITSSGTHATTARKRRITDANTANGGLTTNGFIAAGALQTDDTIWDVTQFTNANVQLTRTQSTTGMFVNWLALAGLRVQRGIITQPTSATTQTITTPFTPRVVLYDSSQTALGFETDAHYIRGIATESVQSAYWAGSKSGNVDQIAQRALRTNKSIAVFAYGTPTLLADAETQLNTDNFTLNWTNTDSISRVYGYLAIG